MVPSRPALRVLVADDKPLGVALQEALDRELEYVCVARVTDIGAVQSEAARHQPDLILLNLFGGGKILQVVGELVSALPACRVLVLSEVASESLARESLRRGATGFLVHSGDVGTLLPRIRACTGRAPAEAAAGAIA
jgi:DNA-binding NarL/FixJ family response regulator